ncbi:MAG TPA: DUF4440 domain-containing protein [Longimicrobiales bacterium]
MHPIALTLITLMPGATMPAPQLCDPPSTPAAVAAVRALNQQYIDAARAHDAAWFDEHMAHDAIIVLGSGMRLSKQSFLKSVREEPTDYRFLHLENVTVRAFGGTVQVDADAPWELSDGRAGVSRYIDTYAWIDCRWQVVSAQITWLPAAQVEPLAVEIRSYNLKPGTRDAFHRLVVEEAVPMLRRWNVDLVAYGPSPHDADSYFLIRAYRSLDDRQRSQDAFYGSAEWIEGPRARILEPIVSYTSIVLPLDARLIEALRTMSPALLSREN